MRLTHLSLFSGIGGLDVAAEWAGFETVGQCEWAEYPRRVLEKHWPEVPKWKDIRTLTGDDFYARTGRRTVDVISGGFPCQPFSNAGKRRGKDDDRYLWPEMVRVISQLRPAWVVGENVAGIINMALDTVLSDLESEGYSTRTFLIPASSVGAPHQRYRTAIVAYSDSIGRIHREPEINAAKTGEQAQPEPFGCGANVAYTDLWEPVRGETCAGKGAGNEKIRGYHREGMPEYAGWEWWSVEPRVGRVADGVPNRVDRLRCLGNAVVPQQFYPVFKAIAETY